MKLLNFLKYSLVIRNLHATVNYSIDLSCFIANCLENTRDWKGHQKHLSWELISKNGFISCKKRDLFSAFICNVVIWNGLHCLFDNIINIKYLLTFLHLWTTWAFILPTSYNTACWKAFKISKSLLYEWVATNLQKQLSCRLLEILLQKMLFPSILLHMLIQF